MLKSAFQLELRPASKSQAGGYNEKKENTEKLSTQYQVQYFCIWDFTSILHFDYLSDQFDDTFG